MRSGGQFCSARRPSPRPSAGTVLPWLLRWWGAGGTEAIIQGPLWILGLGTEQGSFLSWLSPRSCSPHHPVLLPLWGPTALTYCLLCSPPALALSFSVSPIPMLWPLNSRQVRFGRVHTLPLLGPPGARRALPQRRSLSRSLLRYLGQGMSMLTLAGVCMACGLSGVASAVGVPWGS